MHKKSKVATGPKRDAPIIEAANELELSEDTVRRDINRGAPHSRAKKRGQIFVNVPEYRQWRELQGLTGERGRPIEGDSPDLERAKLRKENALAAKYELQVKRERGDLIAIEEVKRWISEHVVSAKHKFIGLGARVTPQLEGRDTAERQTIIDKSVTEILNDLAAA